MAASIMRRYLAQKHTSWSQLCRKRETVRMATRLRMHSAARSTESMAGFHLTWRGVVRVSGRDKVDFLQGLVTNDVTQLCLNKDGIQYAMMLNVQGRVQYDLLLYHNSKLCDDVCFLIECDADLKEDFIKTIKKYKIRKKVDISDASSEYQVWSVLSDNDPNQPEVKVKDSLKSTTENPGAGQASACCFPDALVCLPDPRVPQFGHRVIFRSGEATINMTQKPEDYHEARYMWGIPEGPGDLPPGSCLPLESNLELMNGVSFSKGCYIGQELTARTYHTGVIRKRLVPLLFQNPHEDVASESQINTENGKNAGKFRSLARMHGLGLLRLSFLHEQLSVSSNQGCKINLTSYIPGWWPDGVAKNVS